MATTDKAFGNFDFQPHLASDIVEIRPIHEANWSAVYNAAADPAIWEMHPVRNRWEPHIFREFFDGALASGSGFVILDRQTGEIIGSSRYRAYDAEASEIEIGYTFLARSHWGGTTNGEVKRLMIDHAFRFVENVIFLVGRYNLRSQRAVEKIGGRRDQMRTAMYAGSPNQNIVFCIRKTAWGTSTF